MSKTETIPIENRDLHPAVKSVINKDVNTRIHFIKQPIYIEYDFANEISQGLLDLFDQGLRSRMEGLLLISPTNNGKTFLIKRFILIYSRKIDGKMVYIELPERTTLKEFYMEILNVLGYPTSSARSTGDLRRKILLALQSQNVRMLFIDEIQNLLDSRRDHKKDILNGLKSLSNKAQIPIVLVGVKIAENILAEDDQVADRFPPIELPLWEFSNKFKDLLGTFEFNLPLRKPSNLHKIQIARKIHNLSHGHLGRVATIIRKASIKAIRSGKECITVSLLNTMRYRWKEPLIKENP